MDPIERADSSVRRLQTSLAPGTSGTDAFHSFMKAPFFVRTHAPAERPASVRKMIDDSVVAFVLPDPPIADVHVSCRRALVEYRRTGEWIFNAQVKATVPDKLIFVIGFLTHQSRYFGGMIGALNYPGGDVKKGVSPEKAIPITMAGTSTWIRENYAAAVAEGLTMRIHSSVDWQAPIKDFVLEWAGQFDKTLYRPLGRWDTDEDNDLAWGPRPGMDSGSLLDEASADREGLKFVTRLLFE